MEGENIIQGSLPDEVSTNAGDNTTQTIPEVTSTTQNKEGTKYSFRIQMWRKLKESQLCVQYNSLFHRIPVFVGTDKAALLLTETPEFIKARDIKVMIDRALQDVKWNILSFNKNLYLPSMRGSDALCLMVKVDPDATEEQKKEALMSREVNKYRTEYKLDSKLTLDMVIIGSVVASREGHRIGRGNGFNDLDIGLLTEVGAITPDTLIVTLVHDTQVVDTLPASLFQEYDTPLDMIVTPTEVIRVTNRLPRPSGVLWKYLSERRINMLPSLQTLKMMREEAGQTVLLMENDADYEQNRRQYGNRRFRGSMRRRFPTGRRRFSRRNVSNGNNDSREPQHQRQQRYDSNNGPQQRRFTRRRRFQRNPRSSSNYDRDQHSSEMNQRRGGSEGVGRRSDGDERQGRDDNDMRRRKFRRNRLSSDFAVKLTNVRRGMRIRDLKAELRRRECNPLKITWKAFSGRCFLHFGSRDGQPSTDADMERVLNSLNNLSLSVSSFDNNEGNNYGNEENAANGADGDRNHSGDRKVPAVFNLNVTLIKFDEKRREGATDGGSSGGGGRGRYRKNNGVMNGETVPSNAQDIVASGDTNKAPRIESVDTTTV